MARLVRADGPDFVILDDAQELDLRLQGHVADFIEEDGAAVRVFEEANSLVLRSGEGAAGMPEQFAFEKRVGNGAAVHGHELVVHASDGAGNQVFAYSRFSLDKHGTRMQYGAFHCLAEVLHGFALADQVAHAFAED